jgi:hypothetical protein
MHGNALSAREIKAIKAIPLSCLRLCCCFATRSNHSAQDDTVVAHYHDTVQLPSSIFTS